MLVLFLCVLLAVAGSPIGQLLGLPQMPKMPGLQIGPTTTPNLGQKAEKAVSDFFGFQWVPQRFCDGNGENCTEMSWAQPLPTATPTSAPLFQVPRMPWDPTATPVPPTPTSGPKPTSTPRPTPTPKPAIALQGMMPAKIPGGTILCTRVELDRDQFQLVCQATGHINISRPAFLRLAGSELTAHSIEWNAETGSLTLNFPGQFPAGGAQAGSFQLCANFLGGCAKMR